MKAIHDELPAKFDGEQGYTSSHNRAVMSKLLHQLSGKYKAYSPKRHKRAVHRYYESRRRQVNDKKPSRIAVVRDKKECTKEKLQETVV